MTGALLELEIQLVKSLFDREWAFNRGLEAMNPLEHSKRTLLRQSSMFIDPLFPKCVSMTSWVRFRPKTLPDNPHPPNLGGEICPPNLGGGLSKNTCFTVLLNTHL